MNTPLAALAPFWASFLVSAVCAFPVYKLLLKLKSRQVVSQHAPEGHQVKQGTPTMGGLIIVLGLLAGLFISSLTAVTSRVDRPNGFDDANVIPGLDSALLGAVLVLLVGFASIGFVDDFVVPRLFPGKRGLGWKQKIALQTGIAILATGVLLGWAVTPKAACFVFLILFCANAYNFLDGLDALAGSVLIVLSGGLMLLATMSGGGSISPILQALIGATIPFLFINAPPAKLFMGDVGSLPIGAILGVVFSLLLYPPNGGWTFYTLYSSSMVVTTSGGMMPAMVPSLLVIGLVLIAELVPVPLQIFWVKVFKRKLFVYTPIHHAFEKKGWAESRIVWTFVLVQVLLCVLAYTAMLPAREVVTRLSSSGVDSSDR